MSAPRRILRGGVIGALVLLVAVSSVRSARRFVGDQYLLRANRLVEQQHRDGAVRALEHGLSWDPGRREIAQRLGDILRESYEDLPEVSVSRPSERGRDLLRRSISAYLHAIDQCPGDSWSWWGLGDSYSRLAMEHRWQKGVDLRSFTVPQLERLLPAHRVALAAMERAIALEPNDYQYHDQRAYLLVSLGLVEEAHQEYRRSAEIMPVMLRHSWDRVDLLSEDVARAVADGFEAALVSNRFIPRHETLQNLAEFSSRRSNLSAAEDYYARAVDEATDRQWKLVLRFLLGEIQQREGKDAEALASFEAALAEPGVAAGCRQRRGEIFLRRGEAERAFSEFQRAIDLQPEEARLRTALAEAAERTGRANIAVESLQRAAALSPNDPEPLRRLVELYRARGNRTMAQDVARQLVSAWPQSEEFKRILAELSVTAP